MAIFLYFQSRDLMPWQQHNSHCEVAGSLLSLTTSIRSCGLTIHIKGPWTHAQEYCRHFEFQVPCFKGNERRSLKNEYSNSMTCKSVAGYSAVKLFLSVILLLPSQAHARELHITESVHRTNSDEATLFSKPIQPCLVLWNLLQNKITGTIARRIAHFNNS